MRTHTRTANWRRKISNKSYNRSLSFRIRPAARKGEDIRNIPVKTHMTDTIHEYSTVRPSIGR